MAQKNIGRQRYAFIPRNPIKYNNKVCVWRHIWVRKPPHFKPPLFMVEQPAASHEAAGAQSKRPLTQRL